MNGQNPPRLKTEPDPRYLLDCTFRPDFDSRRQPSRFAFNSKLKVPLIHPRPWSSLGPPARKIMNEVKGDVDHYVYLSTRRINIKDPQPGKYEEPPLQKRSHSEMFKFKSCPNEFDERQILDRSSPHLYPGRYVRPKQYKITASGLEQDHRRPWSAQKQTEPVNFRTEAATASLELLRPSSTRTRYQMGYHFTHRS